MSNIFQMYGSLKKIRRDFTHLQKNFLFNVRPQSTLRLDPFNDHQANETASYVIVLLYRSAAVALGKQLVQLAAASPSEALLPCVIASQAKPSPGEPFFEQIQSP